MITTILPRAKSPMNACLNTTTMQTFHEPLPDSYTIDLFHYRYTIVSTLNNKNGSIRAPTSEGLVKGLPGFMFIDQDCNTTVVSDKSR